MKERFPYESRGGKDASGFFHGNNGKFVGRAAYWQVWMLDYLSVWVLSVQHGEGVIGICVNE